MITERRAIKSFGGPRQQELIMLGSFVLSIIACVLTYILCRCVCVCVCVHKARGIHVRCNGSAVTQGSHDSMHLGNSKRRCNEAWKGRHPGGDGKRERKPNTYRHGKNDGQGHKERKGKEEEKKSSNTPCMKIQDVKGEGKVMRKQK